MVCLCSIHLGLKAYGHDILSRICCRSKLSGPIALPSTMEIEEVRHEGFNEWSSHVEEH